MRQRLLLSAVAVLAAALLAFALPLGVAVRNLLVNRALDSLQGELEQVAAVIDDRARTCSEVQLFLALAPEGPPFLAVYDRGGGLLLTESGHSPEAAGELRAAASGRPGRTYATGRLAAAVPLSTTACGTRLLLHAQQPDDDLAGSIRRSWLGLGAVGLGVLTLAVVGSQLLGRRLARPFEELAGVARRLGEGDFTARAPRSGLEEADAIAEALDTTGERLGRALQRGRAFTADASHQLRTPLTALRLHLETLAEVGEIDEGLVAAAMEEADRLEDTVEELVTLTELDAPARDIDVGELVADRLQPWRDLAAEEGREVVLEVLPTPRVHVRPAAVTQALQVLLDNAIEHGAGTVRVRVEPTLPGGGEPARGARIVVTDEGPGIPPEVAASPAGRDRGEVRLPPVTGGRGLVFARSLVEAEGGRLSLQARPPGTRACIVLPA